MSTQSYAPLNVENINLHKMEKGEYLYGTPSKAPHTQYYFFQFINVNRSQAHVQHFASRCLDVVQTVDYVCENVDIDLKAPRDILTAHHNAVLDQWSVQLDGQDVILVKKYKPSRGLSLYVYATM